MDAALLIRSLGRTSETLAALLADLPAADATWRPDPAAWSIVEIVGHLFAEECDDFRPRLTSTLSDPRAPWPAIDPEAAVHERGFADQPLADLLASFIAERRASLAWLRDLEEPDWTLTYDHGELGTLAAGDLLASWAAHDVLHLRQIASRLHARIEAAAAPHSAGYAGPLT